MSLESPTASRFAVLDIVLIDRDGRPGSSEERGTVTAVRYYPARGCYRYSFAHPELGGILDDHMLAATGDRGNAASFWRPPFRRGDVVEIADSYPKEKWRGFFAVIEHCWDDSDRYGVEITLDEGWAKSGGFKTRCRDIAARHLIPTGDRIPPPPVPRAVTTYLGHDGPGLRPCHEFTIIDEIEQYL